jgi:hypothetical protein
MVDLRSSGRVQGPGLDLTPHLQPGPMVDAVMVQPVNRQGAGSNLIQIADALQSVGNPMSQFFGTLDQQKQTEQAQSTDLYVARIQAGFGAQATQADINNVTSTLHPKVRQRVTEDYMFNVGKEWVSSQLENMPFDTVMSPEAEQSFYQTLRQNALKEAGNDPLRAAGFMKAVQAEIDQRSQQTAAQRTSAWTKVQTDAFGNQLAVEADKVAGTAVLPQLSSAITTTAQKYNAPWLVGYLTRTAQIESGGGRNNLNTGSGAAGPFQFIPSTAKAYGLSDPYDFNMSADAAARLAMDNYNALKNGLGREPTMGELYLAHQQGSGGALSLLTNPTGSATETVGSKAVTANGGSEGMTNGQFASIWMKKFGDGNTLPTDMSSTGPIIPAEAQALRKHFFGVDAEYKLTGSLANAERRDIAAQTFMQKAIQYRDEGYLLAMPEELMTPEIRDQYSKAREQIANLKVSDLRDTEFARDAAEKQTVRDTTFDVINRRASGEQVNPYEVAIGANGKIDPIRLAAAQSAVANSGNMFSELQSRKAAAQFKDEMVNSFLKHDFSGIPLLQFNGDSPTADDLRMAIMLNPSMNDQEKLSLYKSIETDLGTVSFLQSPPVEKWFSTNVSSTLEGMLRDPIISVKLSQYPNIRDQVREAFDLSLMTQIEANGGIPVDMRAILKEATTDAREVITNLTGAQSAPAPTAPSPSPRSNAGSFETQPDGTRKWVPAQ